MSSIETILKKVRKIEIKSKTLSQNIFSGSYHTKFKGRGISFSEIREYVPGDDIRMIDWKVSAKMQKTFVKVFHEERELTAMIIIDVSSTMIFGAQHESKKDYIAEMAGLLSFSAISNNDKVGLILYADKVLKYIPPSRGKSHVLRIIREILTVEYTPGVSSQINVAIDFFNKIHKKKTVCFLMSDFQDKVKDIKVCVLSQKHDLVGIHVYDPIERLMPDVGWIRIKDLATGQQAMVNTSDKNYRLRNLELFDQNAQYHKELFIKHSAAWLSMDVSQDYVKAFQKFFLSR